MQDCTRACNVLNALIMYLQDSPGSVSRVWMLRPVLDVSHFLLRQEPFGSMMFPRRLRMCTGRWIAASRKNMKESGRMHRKNRRCFFANY